MMFFEKIYKVLLKKKRLEQSGYLRVSDLLKNVYGTDARITNVYDDGKSMEIEWTFKENLYGSLSNGTRFTTSLERLQDKYFNMVEYSQGRMHFEEYVKKTWFRSSAG